MLGASTLCFYNGNPQKAAEALAKDFELVEIIAEGNVLLSKKHRLPETKKSIHAPFSDINIASANESVLEASVKEIENSIELACHFGATPVTVHPGKLSPQTWKNPLRAFNTSIASLRRLTEFAEEREVVLAVENMPEDSAFIGKTPQEMEGMMKTVRSKNLRMTLDVGHAHTTRNLSGFIKLKRYIVNIHLHDNAGSDEHLPLGMGAIEFERFFEEFGEYRGNAILELGKMDGMKESKRIAQGLLGRC